MIDLIKKYLTNKKMSKQNRRGFKSNQLKKINFEIKKLLMHSKHHPVGFPHTDIGKKIYFDEIQRLRESKKDYTLNI